MADKSTDAQFEKARPAEGGSHTATLGGDLLSKPNSGDSGGKSFKVASSDYSGPALHISTDDLYKNLGQKPGAQATDAAVQPTDSTAQRGDQPAENKLHAVNMGTSPELANQVQTALDKLPPQVKQQLEKDGVQVYTFKDINQYDAYFGTNKAGQTVDGKTSANADATSLNDLTAKPPRVAIFEQTGKGDKVAQYEDIGGLTRHELGHVVTNKMLPIQGNENWDRDLAVLASGEGQHVPANLRNGMLSHYFHSGPAEIYAETFAMAVGGGSNKTEDRMLQKYFPQTLAYLREKYQ